MELLRIIVFILGKGANLKNILSFEKDYKDTKIVLLEQNYRSTQNILEAANEIIKKKNKYRPDKNLFTKNENGAKKLVFMKHLMKETKQICGNEDFGNNG